MPRLWKLLPLAAPALSLGLFLACGGAAIPEAAKTPEMPLEGSVVAADGFQAPEPTAHRPTPTPRPRPTPDFDAMVQEALAKALAGTQGVTGALPGQAEPVEVSTPTPVPTPTAVPTATPVPTPVPSPTPLVRAVSPPQSSGHILKVSHVSVQGDSLRLSGTVEGQGYDPTSIQVWHAYDPEPYSATCSTERPVAFVQKGSGSVVFTGSSSPYTWTFCRNGVSNRPQTDDVPWIYSQSWSYALRHRSRITDPYIYDYSVAVNLDAEQVERLRYSDGVASGWRIYVFSGDRVIGVQWVGF